jgi:hypothetical protein
MQEKTFFEYEYVKVTNARFMTGGQTFAMNNAKSVKTKINKPSRFGGILILIVGLGIAVREFRSIQACFVENYNRNCATRLRYFSI